MSRRSKLQRRPFLFLSRAVGALILVLAGSGGRAAERVEVTLDPCQVLEKNFTGFGVQWEYEGGAPLLNIDNPLWMARWPEMERRIDYMRPSLLRVMHDARNYTDLKNGKLVLNYDKRNMASVYKILDYAQSRQIPVLFGEWWLEANIRIALEGYESARWQGELFVPLLKHLTEKRKYSVIRYLNLVNEPAGCMGLNEPPPVKHMEFATWRRIILGLDDALAKNGLRSQFQIVGTDGPGDFNDWIRLTAGDPELSRAIDAYEYHIYAHPQTSMWVAGLDDGRLEQEELGRRRRIVNALDPKGRDKPFFMGEAGVDGRKDQADNQPERYHFEYGLRMADYAVQSIRAGQAGLIAWDMDDAMHQWGSYGPLGLKGWGFWNSLAGAEGYPASDFDLRPWYYAWSLVCRYFPRGSQTFDAHALIDTSARTLRVAACKIPDGKGYSIALVNRSEKPLEVKVTAYRKVAAGKMKEFHYVEGALKLNADKEVLPAAVHQEVDLAAGFLLTCPAKAFVVLTSME